MRAKMRGFGRSDNMPPNEGNQNMKIRIDTALTDEEVVQRLRAVPVTASTPTARSTREAGARSGNERLPASELRRVGPEHVRIALERLDAGDPASNFDLSQDYDVKTGDGRTYSPKKVFGLALEEVLGIEARPGHFSAGWERPASTSLRKLACGSYQSPHRQSAQNLPRPNWQMPAHLYSRRTRSGLG